MKATTLFSSEGKREYPSSSSDSLPSSSKDPLLSTSNDVLHSFGKQVSVELKEKGNIEYNSKNYQASLNLYEQAFIQTMREQCDDFPQETINILNNILKVCSITKDYKNGLKFSKVLLNTLAKSITKGQQIPPEVRLRCINRLNEFYSSLKVAQQKAYVKEIYPSMNLENDGNFNLDTLKFSNTESLTRIEQKESGLCVKTKETIFDGAFISFYSGVYLDEYLRSQGHWCHNAIHSPYFFQNGQVKCIGTRVPVSTLFSGSLCNDGTLYKPEVQQAYENIQKTLSKREYEKIAQDVKNFKQIYAKFQNELNNAAFVPTGNKMLVIGATKDIQKGDEVLIDYGSDAWVSQLLFTSFARGNILDAYYLDQTIERKYFTDITPEKLCNLCDRDVSSEVYINTISQFQGNSVFIHPKLKLQYKTSSEGCYDQRQQEKIKQVFSKHAYLFGDKPIDCVVLSTAINDVLPRENSFPSKLMLQLLDIGVINLPIGEPYKIIYL